MSSEKKLPPTAKKLREARKKGDVARSTEFSAALAVSAGIACLFIRRDEFSRLGLFLEKSFALPRDFHTNHMLLSAAEAGTVLLELVLPVVLTVGIAGFLAEAMQVGLHLNFQPLAPDLSKLGFFSGLKRMLDLSGEGAAGGLFSRWLKSALCLLAFFLGCYVVFLRAGEHIYGWEFQNPSQVLLVVASALQSVAEVMLFLLLLLGGIDLGRQRMRRLKRLRMGVEEFRREMRETNGDPEIKAMRRQLQQELVLHRLADSVRKAKVVIIGRD